MANKFQETVGMDHKFYERLIGLHFLFTQLSTVTFIPKNYKENSQKSHPPQIDFSIWVAIKYFDC